MRHAIRTIVLAGCVCIAPLAFGNDQDDRVEDARRECVAHIADLHSSAQTWRWVAIVVAVLGGVTASLTGLKAGLSEPQVGRKWGYAALVAGAIAAASPLLPKTEEFRGKIAASDRHYIVGLKVQRQLHTFDAERSFQTFSANYAISRFTDCLADSPGDRVPDLPKNTGLQEEMVVPKQEMTSNRITDVPENTRDLADSIPTPMADAPPDNYQAPPQNDYQQFAPSDSPAQP
jgi:hypothetical protein